MARGEQRLAAQQWIQRLENLKSNFPLAKSRKYTKEQADEFVWLLIVQELAAGHPEFLKGFKDDVSNLKANVFLSLRIMGYVIFYKY